MSKNEKFDPATSCHDRTLDEMWAPFVREEDRRMRDALFGRSREEYELIEELEVTTAIAAEERAKKWGDRIVTTADVVLP